MKPLQELILTGTYVSPGYYSTALDTCALLSLHCSLVVCIVHSHSFCIAHVYPLKDLSETIAGNVPSKCMNRT